jgi:phosphoribosyl-AMP cyclohydrolase / phosphoribosyl-ATP pyrophosphohydrolase
MTLLPTIVQDSRTGRVLMLGWSNDESRELTSTTGRVHFWSRSKARIWMKGETSANVLDVVNVSTDCDDDAILIRAIPAGPTCHTGSDSCFGIEESPIGVLGRLASTIRTRSEERPDGSYTVTLLDDSDLAARKVLEEAGEVAFAAKDHAAGTGSDDRVAEEAADLIYHLLVLLEAHGVGMEDVGRVLGERAAN